MADIDSEAAAEYRQGRWEGFWLGFMVGIAFEALLVLIFLVSR